MQAVAIHTCYIQSFDDEEIFYGIEKLLEPTLFFNLDTVAIKLCFRKTLVQEKFKFNIKFRSQIIVSAVKFSNSFAKILIPLGALSGISDLHIVKINIICVYNII